MNAMREQSKALLEVTKLLSPSKGDSMMQLASAAEGAAASKVPGARGAAARELLRREFDARPGHYSVRVDQKMARARDGPWVRPDMRASAREFLAGPVPFEQTNLPLIYLAYGSARARDEQTAGQRVQSRDTLA